MQVDLFDASLRARVTSHQSENYNSCTVLKWSQASPCQKKLPIKVMLLLIVGIVCNANFEIFLGKYSWYHSAYESCVLYNINHCRLLCFIDHHMHYILLLGNQ